MTQVDGADPAAEYEEGDINTVAGASTSAAGGASAGVAPLEEDLDEDLDDEDLDDEELDEVEEEELDEVAEVEGFAAAEVLDGVDDMAGNRAEGGTPSAVLTYLARSLASEPDSVVVEVDQVRDTTRLRLFVAPEDMGRVIGRRGRTAQAIRTLIGAAGARDGIRTSVDIVDD